MIGIMGSCCVRTQRKEKRFNTHLEKSTVGQGKHEGCAEWGLKGPRAQLGWVVPITCRAG